VANTRARAGSPGGTSTTCSPANRQPVRDTPADARASLDRPGPLRPLPRLRQHRPVPGHTGALPAPANDGLLAGHDLDRGRTLARVHPDDHLAHLQSLLLDHAVLAEPGGHRYFEPGKPLLSLSPLTAAPGPRRPNESHTTSAGSRNESDEPGTQTEPRQAPVLRQVNK